jgi:hypothetical protein
LLGFPCFPAVCRYVVRRWCNTSEYCTRRQRHDVGVGAESVPVWVHGAPCGLRQAEMATGKNKNCKNTLRNK